MSKKMQHFLNTLLIPNPKIGIKKNEVLLLFNSPFMKDWAFTVHVTLKKEDTFLRPLMKPFVHCKFLPMTFSNTASANLDFTEALDCVEFSE